HSNQKEKRAKLKALKTAYITEKLALTSEEAEKFWPVYNRHEENKLSLRRSVKSDFKKGVSIDEMSDEEVSKMVNANIELKEKELTQYKIFIAELKSILPIKKIAKLNQAERTFKKELLKKIKKGGDNPTNIPPPPPKK
ncbi:MAG: hypothetical protein P1U41_10990, partial [Vicingaceae bacterium]|nr:hypothetical protein [Vicingaceae bacterium]